MNLFEDSPPAFQDQPLPENSGDAPQTQLQDSAVSQPPIGDPFPYGAIHPHPLERNLPEDLRISWSWVHLIGFLAFGFISLMLVQGFFAVAYMPKGKTLAPKELEQYLLSKPFFAIGSMVIWYAILFLFLYLTLAVFRNAPFWLTLGWRKISQLNRSLPSNPWLYFFAGCILSVLIMVITAAAKPPENAPIQDLLKVRSVALGFMAMAVLVAPLVEETIFRGYLYPLFAKTFGIVPGIVVTGILFGLMHGAQLAWTWSIVSALVLVGLVFTFVRAKTGSVLASFLMHLGYNSIVAALALISTRGFTHIPHP